MMQYGEGPRFLADCPARLAIELLSDKWAALVVFGLAGEPRRHGELATGIGGVSRKVLTDTLRRLQRAGLVQRIEEPRRRIAYGLTALGRSLVEPIEVLNTWAAAHAAEIADHRETDATV